MAQAFAAAGTWRLLSPDLRTRGDTLASGPPSPSSRQPLDDGFTDFARMREASNPDLLASRCLTETSRVREEIQLLKSWVGAEGKLSESRCLTEIVRMREELRQLKSWLTAEFLGDIRAVVLQEVRGMSSHFDSVGILSEIQRFRALLVSGVPLVDFSPVLERLRSSEGEVQNLRGELLKALCETKNYSESRAILAALERVTTMMDSFAVEKRREPPCPLVDTNLLFENLRAREGEAQHSSAEVIRELRDVKSQFNTEIRGIKELLQASDGDKSARLDLSGLHADIGHIKTSLDTGIKELLQASDGDKSARLDLSGLHADIEHVKALLDTGRPTEEIAHLRQEVQETQAVQSQLLLELRDLRDGVLASSATTDLKRMADQNDQSVLHLSAIAAEVQRVKDLKVSVDQSASNLVAIAGEIEAVKEAQGGLWRMLEDTRIGHSSAANNGEQGLLPAQERLEPGLVDTVSEADISEATCATPMAVGVDTLQDLVGMASAATCSIYSAMGDEGDHTSQIVQERLNNDLRLALEGEAAPGSLGP